MMRESRWVLVTKPGRPRWRLPKENQMGRTHRARAPPRQDLLCGKVQNASRSSFYIFCMLDRIMELFREEPKPRF